ncbi:MAG: mercury transporter [Gracilibacteraceae bacterium]|nr:mercury transporter [Gracilibacteraceae bacterium]
MPYVDEISKAVIILIRAGLACRVTLCLIALMTAEEEAAQYKKRIRNAVVFYIAAELAFVIKNIIIYYFS